MINIIKGKNYCQVTGDRGTLDYFRNLMKKNFSVVDKNYQFIERNRYYTLNQIKKLNNDVNGFNDLLKELKRKRANNSLSAENYKFQSNAIRLQRQEQEKLLDKKKQSLINLERYLKYNQESICFYKEGKNGKLDNYEKGLHRRVIKLLKANKITYRVTSAIKYPKIKVNEKSFNRDYQLQAVQKIFKAKQGIIKLPTGSGKTEIARQFFDHLLPYIKKRKTRLLFVVEQSDLLLKTREEDFTDITTGKYRFSQKISIGLLGAGFQEYNKDIVICTVQTLGSLLKREPQEFKKWATEFDAFVVDECDMFTTEKRLRILRYFVNAKWRLFLSATPFSRFKELQKWKLISISGGVIYTVKEQELIKKKFLSSQQALFIDNYCIENDKRFYGKGKWQAVYKELIVKGKHRNLGIIKEVFKILNKLHVISLFIVENIEHGRFLAENLNIPFYSGANDIVERRQVIEDVQKHNKRQIITTRIFRRAVNIPELQVYVNCAGMKSDNIVTQGKGRIGRLKKKNESKSLYIDIFDYGNTILENHSLERMKTLENLNLKIDKIGVKDIEKYLTKYFNRNKIVKV